MRVKWRYGALIGASMLAGCAITPAPRVTVEHAAAVAVQAVRFAPPAEDEPATDPVRTAFAEKLAKALAQYGVRVSSDAAVVVTLALAQRPASVGVTQANSGSAADIPWLSGARKHRLLDRCHPTRNEIVVSGLRDGVAAPEIMLRGVFDACRNEQGAFDALADDMARTIAGR